MAKLTILNVEAREADRGRFAILHQITAEQAEPLFRAQIRNFASQDLAQDFVQEARLLQQFLADKSGLPQQDEMLDMDFAELETQLANHLRQPLSESAAQEEDEKLAKQFALEFAGGMWTGIIAGFCRQSPGQELMKAGDLLAPDPASEQPPLLQQIAADSAHFEVTLQQLHDVMAHTLSALLKSKLADQDTLYLPRGLRMDCAELRAHLDQVMAHRQHYQWVLASDASSLDQWRKHQYQHADA